MAIPGSSTCLQGRRGACAVIVAALVTPSLARADTWSPRSFGNDGALDWVELFLQRPNSDFLSATLAQGIGGREIARGTGESVVAACEVVAASWGRPCSDFPIELIMPVARSRLAIRPLTPLARSALGGVLGPASELRRRWGLDADGLANWQDNVRKLLERL